MARLPNVARDEMDAAGRDAYDRLLHGMNSRPGNPATQIGGIYGLLLNSPELASCVASVGDSLLREGDIGLDVKEITCLAVARELNCQYEWTIHEPVARSVGLTDELIAAIHDGALERMHAQDRQLVEFTLHVLRNDLDDALWQAVEHRFGTRRTVNLSVMIAFTALICHCMDAFAIDLPPGVTPTLKIR
jgi:4-carboxymuconolactone decarboxylase